VKMTTIKMAAQKKYTPFTALKSPVTGFCTCVLGKHALGYWTAIKNPT